MFKKIILSIVIIFGMISTASASIRPNYVELFYGYEPATWMAILAVVCALIDNLGRAWDKKRKDSEFVYNYAYLNSTILASVGVGLIVLGMDITNLGLHEILGAVSMGFGGNLLTKEATKGTR